MPSEADPVTQLIRERRLVEARAKIIAILANNPRVWGLDQQLKTIDSRLVEARELLDKAEQLSAENCFCDAAKCYQTANAISVDLPSASEGLAHAQQVVDRARSLLKDARNDLESGLLDEADTTAKEALRINADDPIILRFQTQLANAFEVRRIERKRHRRDFTVMAICILLALIFGGSLVGGVILKLGADTDRDTAAAAIEIDVGEAWARIHHEEYAQAQQLLLDDKKLLEAHNITAGPAYTNLEAALNSNDLKRGLSGLVVSTPRSLAHRKASRQWR